MYSNGIEASSAIYIITILQFNYILEDSGLSTTKKKAKIWLKKMGIKETTTRINSKVTKVYKGIKALEDEESEYNGGVTVEAPSDLGSFQVVGIR